MSNSAKVIRSQVRNVVAEILDEVLAKEIFKTLETNLRTLQTERLKNIEELVRKTLDDINQRQKDIQTLVIREVSNIKNSAPKE